MKYYLGIYKDETTKENKAELGISKDDFGSYIESYFLFVEYDNDNINDAIKTARNLFIFQDLGKNSFFLSS